MKFFVLAIILMTISKGLFAQTDTTKIELKTLQEVVIKAYESNRQLAEIPASIIVIDNQSLQRFSNISLVPAININPGVRMEERSPGSYRLNIRGSSLRSPFGVRNVKVYYNDIPYTDPGGNTFLNQLGFYNIESMEVIKGPGSSLYGAGTGGVLLIRSDKNSFAPGFRLSQVVGSFDQINSYIKLGIGNDSINNAISYQRLTSDGYRDHTDMKRETFTWDGTARFSNGNKLQAHFLYADLFYKTPGALTRQEFNIDPKASRPAAGTNPSATAAKAAISQQSFISGLSYTNNLLRKLTNTSSIYGAYTLLKNPAIRNYERRTEPHFGGRTVFNYEVNIGRSEVQLTAGAEFQKRFCNCAGSEKQEWRK